MLNRYLFNISDRNILAVIRKLPLFNLYLRSTFIHILLSIIIILTFVKFPIAKEHKRVSKTMRTSRFMMHVHYTFPSEHTYKHALYHSKIPHFRLKMILQTNACITMFPNCSKTRNIRVAKLLDRILTMLHNNLMLIVVIFRHTKSFKLNDFFSDFVALA